MTENKKTEVVKVSIIHLNPGPFTVLCYSNLNVHNECFMDKDFKTLKEALEYIEENLTFERDNLKKKEQK